MVMEVVDQFDHMGPLPFENCRPSAATAGTEIEAFIAAVNRCNSDAVTFQVRYSRYLSIT